MGLRSYPSGSFVPKTLPTSFSLFRSDRLVYATASNRPSGPCQPSAALAGPTFSYLRNPNPQVSGGFHNFYGRLHAGVGRSHGGFPNFRYLDSYRPQAPHQLFGAQGGSLCPTALGSSAPEPPGYDRYRQFDSSIIYQQARRDPFPHLATFDSRTSPLVRGSEHYSPSTTYSRLPERDSRPPISSKSANIDRVVPSPRNRETYLQGCGTPEDDMFATVSNSHLPRFMSPILEPRALAVDALSQDLQGRSMYMFPPFHQSHSEAPVHPGGRSNSCSPPPGGQDSRGFPHLFRLCVDHPCVLSLPSRSSVPAGSEVCLGRKVIPSARMEALMRHYKAAGFSDKVPRLAAAPKSKRPSTNRTYDDRWLRFAPWAAGQGFDPLDPTAAQIASFLFTLFNTHGLSPQTVKGYRACLGSVLNRTGKAKVVMHQTISNMIVSMDLQRPRVTPVFPQWDLGIVLEALSKPPCEPLREASFKHLTLKTVFLLAMASAGRRSKLQALRFDQNYLQFKPQGAGVTLYFSPEFMRKNQKPNQVNDPWYIPAVPTGKSEFGAPNCPVTALRYYHRHLTEHPELGKDKRRLFVPIKENNAGKELSASTISRWI